MSSDTCVHFLIFVIKKKVFSNESEDFREENTFFKIFVLLKKLKQIFLFQKILGSFDNFFQLRSRTEEKFHKLFLKKTHYEQ